MTIFRETFTTPYDQYADREGQPFTVLRVITEADDEHDEEVLPMYAIRFEDGFETEAWPEEVEAVCAHCGRPIEDDDGTWYHPDTMSARCDGPDDESGLYWSDMIRQAEPAEEAKVDSATLNVRFNEADILALRQHIRRDHKSLLDPVCDGPLPNDNLSGVPDDVLVAIHQANHMVPWWDHGVADWRVRKPCQYERRTRHRTWWRTWLTAGSGCPVSRMDP